MKRSRNAAGSAMSGKLSVLGDDELEVADGTPKVRLRPEARRERTDIAFREIMDREAAARNAKSERLRLARLEARGSS